MIWTPDLMISVFLTRVGISPIHHFPQVDGNWPGVFMSKGVVIAKQTRPHSSSYCKTSHSTLKAQLIKAKTHQKIQNLLVIPRDLTRDDANSPLCKVRHRSLQLTWDWMVWISDSFLEFFMAWRSSSANFSFLTFSVETYKQEKLVRCWSHLWKVATRIKLIAWFQKRW